MEKENVNYYGLYRYVPDDGKWNERWAALIELGKSEHAIASKAKHKPKKKKRFADVFTTQILKYSLERFFADIYASGCARRFSATGQIHRIPKETIARHTITDDTSDNFARMDTNRNLLYASHENAITMCAYDHIASTIEGRKVGGESGNRGE